MMAEKMGANQTELLAPAGNWECARAAVANGADAIYFGLPRFNARMRADNFSAEDLPKLMAFLHAHGVRGFAAFNTLIFTGELADAEAQLRLLSDAGVDAIIVQDTGLARLARAVTPELEIHASTQMTITSPEGLELVSNAFHLDRAVIARENSLKDMQAFRADQPGATPLEVFVHGALCVAYSGQCLTSESLGQRSANRGECAQACRMPYELVVDGQPRDLEGRNYLLSPQDLAGAEEIPQLLARGVRSFKIEGRLKSPEYVAAVTRVYRKAIDAALVGATEVPLPDEDRYELEMTFSRGFHSGWLNGIDNKSLVLGRFGKKRGAFLGAIQAIGPDWVELAGNAPVQPGDGVVFENPRDTNDEQGGRVYEVRGRRLFFQRGKVDFRELRKGIGVWKTSDPKLDAELRRTWENAAPARRKVQWSVAGKAGEKMVLRDDASGLSVTSGLELQPAAQRPMTAAFLQEQLGRLGQTAYELAALTVSLDGDVILPVSELNRLRRALVEQLDRHQPETPKRRVTETSFRDLLPARPAPAPGPVQLSVLCRAEDQIGAAMESGIERLYLDFEDMRRFKDAVSRVRSENPKVEIFLATPRIQKPGEAGLFKLLERAEPDGILARNLGAVAYFGGGKTRPRAVGDFSLNVANPISANFFREQGLERLTVSYDLNISQVLDLLRAAPPDWFELTLHQHMPMFHMEHCVFCTFLSEGTDVTNCGRPCDKHEVSLRDRVGQLHILSADVGCRNTLFNGRAQSGARFVGELQAAGLRNFRVELLKEPAAEAAGILRMYQGLLDGRVAGDEVWRKLKVDSRLGVTEGALLEQPV